MLAIVSIPKAHHSVKRRVTLGEQLCVFTIQPAPRVHTRRHKMRHRRCEYAFPDPTRYLNLSVTQISLHPHTPTHGARCTRQRGRPSPPWQTRGTLPTDGLGNDHTDATYHREANVVVMSMHDQDSPPCKRDKTSVASSCNPPKASALTQTQRPQTQRPSAQQPVVEPSKHRFMRTASTWNRATALSAAPPGANTSTLETARRTLLKYLSFVIQSFPSSDSGLPGAHNDAVAKFGLAGHHSEPM